MASHLSSNSWIGKTGQGWKVIVFLVLAFADFCLFALGTWQANHPAKLPSFPLDLVTLGLSFVGLGVLTFAWLWFSIRCPDCRKRAVGQIAKNATLGNWFTTLITLVRCPHCGSSGESPRRVRPSDVGK